MQAWQAYRSCSLPIVIFFSAWFTPGEFSAVRVFPDRRVHAVLSGRRRTSRRPGAAVDQNRLGLVSAGLIAGFVALRSRCLGLLYLVHFRILLPGAAKRETESIHGIRRTYATLYLFDAGGHWPGGPVFRPVRSVHLFPERVLPARPEDRETPVDLESLDTLYDELWEDARTLVGDMNQSIAVYRIAGLFLVISGIVLHGLRDLRLAEGPRWRALAPSTSSLRWRRPSAAWPRLLIGPYFLYWHDKLRKRYVNLARMEKPTGD